MTENNNSEIDEYTNKVFQEIEELDETLEITRDDIREKFVELDNMGVRPEQAEDSVVRQIANSYENITENDIRGRSGEETEGNNEIKIGDIQNTGDESWISLKGEVVDVFEPDNENISQKGWIMGEDEEVVEFVSWAKSDVVMLVEGEQYKFNNAVTNKFRGNVQVTFNSNTEINPIDNLNINTEAFEDMMIGDVSLEEVPIVNLREGLIKRDKDSGEVVESTVTENVEYDLRLKAILDTGKEVFNNVILNREQVENLTGITLEEAINIAENNMDQKAPLRKMKEKTLCRYFDVEGEVQGDYMFINNITKTEKDININNILVKARGGDTQ